MLGPSPLGPLGVCFLSWDLAQVFENVNREPNLAKVLSCGVFQSCVEMELGTKKFESEMSKAWGETWLGCHANPRNQANAQPKCPNLA